MILAVSLAVWFCERGAGQEAETSPNPFYDPDPRVIAQLSQRKPTYLVHNWIDCKVKDCPDCSEELK
ncbi:MAG: hypothetical protein Q8O57_06210, partial [Kiritimatiellota bacterium]|nr:hypothetical protein [Kiritimatiellota bacterium]